MKVLHYLEDKALMEFAIDGIRRTKTNKSCLYGATSMKEFRKELELYSYIEIKSLGIAPFKLLPEVKMRGKNDDILKLIQDVPY